MRPGPHPVSGVPGLLDELLYLLNVPSDVVNLGELGCQVLHLGDLVFQIGDAF